MISALKTDLENEAAAISFAVKAHMYQIYRGYEERQDEPYYWHPLRVATSVPQDCRIVALLHDVLEDTGFDLPSWVSAEDELAIRALTRDKKNETYAEYIQRVKAFGGKAVIVKLADLADNMAHAPQQSLINRYAEASEQLKLPAK